MSFSHGTYIYPENTMANTQCTNSLGGIPGRKITSCFLSILDKCAGITCLDGNNEQANSCDRSSGICDCKVNFYRNPTSNACEEGMW